MAIIAKATWKGFDLDAAYFRITRLELRKDESTLTAEFQMHKTEKKEGNLDYVSIQTEYVPGEDLFVTAFNALKEHYTDAQNI